MCKCLLCGKEFDRNDKTIEWVQMSARRYAHKLCSEDINNPIVIEAKKEQELRDYIGELLGDLTNWSIIARQIKEYHDRLGMDYIGMKNTLKYFYVTQGNKIQKAKGGIGIIPYMYKEACEYYEKIDENKKKVIDTKELKNVRRTIVIESPKSRPIQKRHFNID